MFHSNLVWCDTAGTCCTLYGHVDNDDIMGTDRQRPPLRFFNSPPVFLCDYSASLSGDSVSLWLHCIYLVILLLNVLVLLRSICLCSCICFSLCGVSEVFYLCFNVVVLHLCEGVLCVFGVTVIVIIVLLNFVAFLSCLFLVNDSKKGIQCPRNIEIRYIRFIWELQQLLN